MTLHKNTVTETIWNLILEMMQLSELREFRLVGGTALALQLGHRQSIDIDLFSDAPFDASFVVDNLVASHHLSDVSVARNSVSGSINGVKVDIISHQYPWINDAVVIDGIRLASVSDIVAMKLNAISNRGSKKDFWDISALLQKFNISEMLDIFSKRYPHINQWQVIRSMTYFNDAEADPDPVVFDDTSWPEIKSKIQSVARDLIE